jgi:hypothetical protein
MQIRFILNTTMRKMVVLQLALQLNFWVVEDICNPQYLYNMCANTQVAWIAIHHIHAAIHYNSIAI